MATFYQACFVQQTRSSRGPVSCRQPCGKVMSCRLHRCQRLCHPGACERAGGAEEAAIACEKRDASSEGGGWEGGSYEEGKGGREGGGRAREEGGRGETAAAGVAGDGLNALKGCGVPCGKTLECGHACARACHPGRECSSANAVARAASLLASRDLLVNHSAAPPQGAAGEAVSLPSVCALLLQRGLADEGPGGRQSVSGECQAGVEAGEEGDEFTCKSEVKLLQVISASTPMIEG